MRAAVCSGSFDPITLGHLDIITRTAAIFDCVWVCVSPNAEKRAQMFTPERKLALVRAAVAHLPNVAAELYPGLLADYARQKEAVIVRGVRNGTDWDAESQLALINKSIHPELETLLLPARGEYQYLSSSMAREMIRYGQPLERCLPGAVVPLVRDMMKKGDDSHG